MNIPKADILNPESDSPSSTSAAVKLALAETHIIQETKSYLESEGIDLASFTDLATIKGQRVGRSDTCILVKNIPYGTSANQIRELFESHGELSRVLVPPAGTLAVVDFVHPDDAARAFKAVVYRRLGSSIIYLEKAPVGIFVPKEEEDGAPVKPAETTYVGKHAVRIQDEDVTGRSLVTEDSAEAAPGSTLFIKNLSFATTPERFTSAFRHLPSFAFARVQTKPDPKGPGRLSMGYGFIGFKDAAAAKSAMQSMNDFVLDGHALVVKTAGRGHDEVEGKLKGEKVNAKTTKMIVKNVPFEASKKDIRELFGCVAILTHYWQSIFLLRSSADLTANSNQSVYQSNSMPVHAASLSWTSSPVMKLRTHITPSNIPICWADIWSLTGPMMKSMLMR